MTTFADSSWRSIWAKFSSSAAVVLIVRAQSGRKFWPYASDSLTHTKLENDDQRVPPHRKSRPFGQHTLATMIFHLQALDPPICLYAIGGLSDPCHLFDCRQNLVPEGAAGACLQVKAEHFRLTEPNWDAGLHSLVNNKISHALGFLENITVVAQPDSLLLVKPEKSVTIRSKDETNYVRGTHQGTLVVFLPSSCSGGKAKDPDAQKLQMSRKQTWHAGGALRCHVTSSQATSRHFKRLGM